MKWLGPLVKQCTYVNQLVHPLSDPICGRRLRMRGNPPRAKNQTGISTMQLFLMFAFCNFFGVASSSSRIKLSQLNQIAKYHPYFMSQWLSDRDRSVKNIFSVCRKISYLKRGKLSNQASKTLSNGLIFLWDFFYFYMWMEFYRNGFPVINRLHRIAERLSPFWKPSSINQLMPVDSYLFPTNKTG